MKKLVEEEIEARKWKSVVLTQTELEGFLPLVEDKRVRYVVIGTFADVRIRVYVDKAEENYLNGCLAVITS